MLNINSYILTQQYLKFRLLKKIDKTKTLENITQKYFKLKNISWCADAFINILNDIIVYDFFEKNNKLLYKNITLRNNDLFIYDFSIKQVKQFK